VTSQTLTSRHPIISGSDRLLREAPPSRGTLVACPDLGAHVALGWVPSTWAAILPALYSSAYSVMELMTASESGSELGACRLDDPEHVLVFARHGRTAAVLNRLIDIAPGSVTAAADAILRAAPDVARVTVQLQFDPAELARPTLTRQRLSDFVVALPAPPARIDDTLSRSTRKHLRNYHNRLRRDYPDHEFEVVTGEAIDETLLRSVAELIDRRMRSKGDTSQLPSDYALRMLPFARCWGCVGLIRVNGAVVAADLCSHVGDQAFDHAGSFDPDFERYELGWACILRNMDYAASHGCRKFHLLWGDHRYKRRLGAVPTPLFQTVIYRSSFARLAAVRDWGGLAADSTRTRAARALRRARRRGGRGIRTLRHRGQHSASGI